jgi:hypothetical protein
MKKSFDLLKKGHKVSSIFSGATRNESSTHNGISALKFELDIFQSFKRVIKKDVEIQNLDEIRKSVSNSTVDLLKNGLEEIQELIFKKQRRQLIYYCNELLSKVDENLSSICSEIVEQSEKKLISQIYTHLGVALSKSAGDNQIKAKSAFEKAILLDNSNKAAKESMLSLEISMGEEKNVKIIYDEVDLSKEDNDSLVYKK